MFRIRKSSFLRDRLSRGRASLSRRVRALRADEKGSVAQIFAVTLVPLAGFSGFALDYARLSLARADLQAAIDSGLDPTVITLDPHPRIVLGNRVDMISTLERRLELLAEAGVADTLVAIEQDANTLKADAAATDAAKASLDVARLQYKDGYAAYLAVLNADQAYQQARLAAGRSLFPWPDCPGASPRPLHRNHA